MAQFSQPEAFRAQEARNERRGDEAARELVRALLIINAGGAGALLLFLEKVFSNTSLAKWTLVGIVILSAGALFASAFHFFRYEASLRQPFVMYELHSKGNKTTEFRKFRMLTRCYRWSASLSLAFFLIAILLVAFGAWSELGRVVTY